MSHGEQTGKPQAARLSRDVYVISATLALAVIVWVGYLLYTREPGEAMTDIERIQPVLTVIRLSLAALIIGGWPRWMAILGRHYGLGSEVSQALIQARWRLAGFIAFVELAVVQGGANALMNWLL